MAGDSEAIARFVARWRANEGGAERANYVLFLTELCALLDLPGPDPADASHAHNDYVFERAVTFEDADGRTSRGRIDLYKRGCFVLEAKQSRERGGEKEVALGDQPALPGIEAARGRRSAHRGWDVLMRNAREQAEQYARALPASHGWPPFLLVVDVGHAIEMFADFSGQGKNYRQFPDRGGFRVYLDDLHDKEVRDRLRAVWLDPHSLDPARKAAEATRDIARRLAEVSKMLEARGHSPEPVAHFLMRCLFTMFAEDTGLLEVGCFAELLADAKQNPEGFAPLLEDLWKSMNRGGTAPVLRKRVRQFNGGLFADARAIPLNREEIGELYEAALRDWKKVEPAIFGTLLEQALDADERRRLGAHYTPRTYVERLVNATVIEPLKAEWEGAVLGTVERERAHDPQAAVRAVHDFHVRLCTIRILDPACGTGNFLYVALELLKQLEGDVLEVLNELGGQDALAMETAMVHPRQFLGMELNTRAAAIAELVLWLGYLQWQMRNGAAISDPVLERLDNIIVRDAVLKHDGERVNLDRSDTKYINPRRPEWPQADFIVGNPPFIGKGAALRSALGDHYVEALWKAHPKVNRSADFVMYWWDRAADILAAKGSRLKRFGFVTTNSITQAFNRRVIARRLGGRAPISLVKAIPDHPWTKATRDAATVRIAMTVAEAGIQPGTLFESTTEKGLESDAPELSFRETTAPINADLSIGSDITSAFELRANRWLAYNGMMLAGRGFLLTGAQAAYLRTLAGNPSSALIKPYANGISIVRRRPERFVIDTSDLEQTVLRTDHPVLYQHLLQAVKPEREGSRDRAFREHWWRFGRIRPDLRAALRGLDRYIATTETTKHRTFQFLPGAVVPDHMIIAIGLDDGFSLGVLSSRIHIAWTLAAGGTLEDRPRYNKSLCFDTYPFPSVSPEQRKHIADLAEELDATRKNVLEAHLDLTLTELYNLRAKLGDGAAFTAVEMDQRRRGRVDVMAELHDRLDAAVADAYGWSAEHQAGRLTPPEIVTRLVSLNAERHSEERAGKVRWLRPAYQIARAGVPQLVPAGETQIEAALPAAAARKPAFPRDAIGQTAAVLAALRGGGALDSAAIAGRYAQGRRIEPRVAATLAALARLGHLSREADGYRLRKAA